MADAVIIGAPSSGSGKTVITMALLRALRRKGVTVTSAKVGPDYIDPMFHAAATGRDCINLDPWAMPDQTLKARLARHSNTTDLVIIEGVMGLFDGAAGGRGSTADLAETLDAPVILVVDCSHQAQSVTALVKGFRDHRPGLRFAGVILNRVASDRHEKLLMDALTAEQLYVLGCFRRNPDLNLPSRHLGLVQAEELSDLEEFLDRAADAAVTSMDLDALPAVACPIDTASDNPTPLPPLGQRIAVARDSAFRFCYGHAMDDWHRKGAEILYFSPLNNEPPDPSCDAVFLPGGYPELHGASIASNTQFMAGLRDAAARGCLIYGECGGYMVLGEGLIGKDGTRNAMAGLLPVTTSFETRQLSLGYRDLSHTSPLPFASQLKGHEFHYSTLVSSGSAEPLFEATDSTGMPLGGIGSRVGNVMGSYAHIIDQVPPA